jgi:hypothetical protein
MKGPERTLFLLPFQRNQNKVNDRGTTKETSSWKNDQNDQETLHWISAKTLEKHTWQRTKSGVLSHNPQTINNIKIK